MKRTKIIILFLFAINSVFSQEKVDTPSAADVIKTSTDSLITKVNSKNWSIEIGTGVSNGTMPYTDGYYTSIDNQLFQGIIFNTYTLGATYQFSEIVGLKMDVAFDRFIDSPETKSEPFESAQYRTSVQAVFNINSFFKPFNSGSRSNVLLHGGFNIGLMLPIKGDYDKEVSNNDTYGGIVFGITPTLKVSKKTSIFLDVSSYNNYGQNLTWNGKDAAKGFNGEGHMYSITFGLSFALNADKKQDQAVVNNIKLDNDIITTKAVDTKVIAIDSTETVAKVSTVIPATPVTTEGILSNVTDSDQAKKLINQGYVAVYFNLGDTKPTGNTTEAIGFILTYLRNNPSSTVDIIGSTDQIGTDEFNEKLATERAQSLKDILLKAGVSPSRMTIIAKGKDNSVDVNSVDARSLVRTVKFIIKD